MRQLYIEQAIFKITDHYPIQDQSGEPVYQVDQDFTFFGYRAHLSASGGGTIFTMERSLLTFLPRYEVCFHDGRPTAVIESQLSVLKRMMRVYSAGVEFFLEGNLWDFEFSLQRNGQAVGDIRKERFRLRDCFEITVRDESVEALMIAVMIAVDNMKDEER